MFRKLLIASVASLGLVSVLAPAAKADSNIRFGLNGGYGFNGQGAYPGYASRYAPPVFEHRHYHVLYRPNCNVPWREYGTYRSHGQAHQVEHRLEARGFEARIDHH